MTPESSKLLKKVATYVPGGDIPDYRGFAPSIVAQYFGSTLKQYNNIFIAYNENNRPVYEKTSIGEVFRIKESALYRRLFKKVTKLDPYPLHKRLAKIINKCNVDILHAHQLEVPITKVKQLCANKLLKTVVHAHALRTYRSELGTADVYLAVASYTKKRMVEEFGFPESRVKVLHNGVDIDLFRPGTKDEVLTLKQEFGFSNPDLPVLGYVGRRHENKGYCDFLRTVRHFADNGVRVNAICVGAYPKNAYPDYEKYEELHNELVQHGLLISIDALQHSELAKVYRVIDVLQFHTRFVGEQHPVVMVEAIASGCLVLASNLAGIPETITDGKNGYLIKDSDSLDGLFKQTEDIIEQIDELEEIRKNARLTAETKLSWAALSRKLELIYDSL